MGKNLPTNFVSLSVIQFDGIPYEMFHALKNPSDFHHGYFGSRDASIELYVLVRDSDNVPVSFRCFDDRHQNIHCNKF